MKEAIHKALYVIKFVWLNDSGSRKDKMYRGGTCKLKEAFIK